MFFLLSDCCTLEPKKSYDLVSTNATKSILLEWIYDVKSVLQERIEAYLQRLEEKVEDKKKRKRNALFCTHNERTI